jgi:hypothetical protein
MRKFKWLRILTTILGIIVLLDLAWFFGTRRYLRSDKFLRLVNTPDLQFAVKDGYSPWPGYFIFHSFVFTGFGPKATYQVKAGSIAFHLNPFLLLRNEVALRALTIEDVSIDVGEGPNSPAVAAEKKAQIEAEEARRARENGGVKPYWTIRFAQAVMQDVKEFRVHDWAFRGKAKIKASFWLDTEGLFEIEDSKVKIDEVNVFQKERRLGSLQRAAIDSTIARFNLENEPFSSILEKVDTRWRLKGQLDKMDTLGAYLSQLRWLKLSGSALKVKGDIAMAKAQWKEASELRFAADALHVKVLGQTIDGQGDLLWRVEREGAKLSRIDFNFGQYTLNEGRDGEGEGFRLALTTPDKSVLQKQNWSDWRADMFLPPTRIHRIQFLQAYLPPSVPLKLEKGRGEIKGELHASSDGKGSGGHLDIAVDDMTIGYRQDLSFAGSLRSRTEISHMDLPRGLIDVKDMGIDIKGLSFLDRRGWAGSIHMTQARLKAEKPLFLKSEINVKGDDLQPFLAFLAKDKDFPSWALKAFDLKNPTMSFAVDATESDFKIRDFEAKGGDLAIEGWMDQHQGDSRGKFLFQYARFTGAWGWHGDDSEWKILGAKDWYHKDLSVGR